MRDASDGVFGGTYLRYWQTTFGIRMTNWILRQVRLQAVDAVRRGQIVDVSPSNMRTHRLPAKECNVDVF